MKDEKTKKLIESEISEQMRTSYMEYAMSVIIARALPDLRDGLKPVQRRILYSMYEMGLHSFAKFRKSAAVVGETMAKFHPHGDAPIYEALVRMAQDFTLRYPLIEGQGNFGSIDGDPAASMRYTECRLSKIGELMLKDIEKETVDFVSNYDGTKIEPNILPSPIPQILINGALGIAVGMATSIPPHNLSEVIDALVFLLENKKAKPEDLFKFFRGPDFPTGGEIFNFQEIKKAYLEGKGSILIRGKYNVVKKGDREIIVFTQIPYQVEKSALLEEIAKLVLEKKIKGIKDVRDESDKEGLRIVIELQKGILAKSILPFLFKFTDLEKRFYLNMLVLVDGIQPRILNFFEILNYFLEHRRQIVRRKTEYLLKKSNQRSHILEGLLKCILNLDLAIKIIRSSRDRETAKKNLMQKFKIDEVQADAILEIKLASLVRMEREKIQIELKELKEKIANYNLILKDPRKIDEEIKKELLEIKKEFGDERKTKVNFEEVKEFSKEELIPSEPTLVLITQEGYIKRTTPTIFKAQKKEKTTLNKEENIANLILTNTQNNLLFFTASGKVFKFPVWEIEEGRREKGKKISSYLNIEENERICSICDLKKDEKKISVLLVTKKGQVKKISLEIQKIKKSGLSLISFGEGDSLENVEKVSSGDEIILLTKKGRILRFKEKEIKEMGRQAKGVRGISLKKGDEVLTAQKLKGKKLLLVFENNLGKIVSLKDIRLQKRGGKGMKVAKINEKTGEIVFAKVILDEEDLILFSKEGKSAKIKLSSLPQLSRKAKGVKLMNLEPNDKILKAVCF